MRRERAMLSSPTKIKINLIASLLHWHDSCCESSNQKGKLILQLLIKWYLCAPSYYSRRKNNCYFGEFVHTIFHRNVLCFKEHLYLIWVGGISRWCAAWENCMLHCLIPSQKKKIYHSAKSKVCFKLNSPLGICLATMKLLSHTKKG